MLENLKIINAKGAWLKAYHFSILEECPKDSCTGPDHQKIMFSSLNDIGNIQWMLYVKRSTVNNLPLKITRAVLVSYMRSSPLQLNISNDRAPKMKRGKQLFTIHNYVSILHFKNYFFKVNFPIN